MIAGRIGTAVLRPGADGRSGRRIARGSKTADARSDERRGGAGSTALVPVDPAPADAPRSFARPQASAPFIAQLATAYLGTADGDRRARRDPVAVAPRASGAYRAADRLATEIEPGFLARRDV